MGGIGLWGTGGTHCACMLTADLLHMVTCSQDPQFLSRVGGGNLQKPSLNPHVGPTSTAPAATKVPQDLLARMPSVLPL